MNEESESHRYLDGKKDQLKLKLQQKETNRSLISLKNSTDSIDRLINKNNPSNLSRLEKAESKSQNLKEKIDAATPDESESILL